MKIIDRLRKRLALFLLGTSNAPHSHWYYLSPANGPVIDGLESHESVFAQNQPQYTPLRTLRSRYQDSRVMSRWSLSDEQRAAIASGADIYLELLTFRNPLQPILMAVGRQPNPDYIRSVYGLDHKPSSSTRPPGPPEPPRPPHDKPVG